MKRVRFIDDDNDDHHHYDNDDDNKKRIKRSILWYHHRNPPINDMVKYTENVDIKCQCCKYTYSSNLFDIYKWKPIGHLLPGTKTIFCKDCLRHYGQHTCLKRHPYI